MNKLTSHALAAAVAGIVAGGLALAVTPPAAAAPHGVHAKAGHTKAGHAKAADDKGPGKAQGKAQGKAHGKGHAQQARAKAAKADRKVVQTKRLLTKEVVRKDAFLARVLRAPGMAGFETDVQDAVRTSIVDDRTALAELKAQVAAAADLKQLGVLRTDLRDVRPVTYHRILGLLSQAGALEAEALELGLADVVAEVEGLSLALAGYDARTPWSELKAVAQALDAVAALVEAAEPLPEPEEPVEEPVDQPVEEPVDGYLPAS